MYTDNQLLDLIKIGLSDSEILSIVHANSKPSDLYGAVAEVVTQALHEDPVLLQVLKNVKPDSALWHLKEAIRRLKDDEVFQEVTAWWRVMGISRKDTKSIVMTYLYGSTEYGNRDSIQERIDERADECLEKLLEPYYDRSGADVWKEHRTKAITVMVRLTRGAMGLVCPSTVKTMDYIQGMAETLGAMDIPYKYRNHLGFTFYQDNPNLDIRRAEIWENGKCIMNMQYRVPVENGKRLNEKKMKAGVAPDTVHCNDACHLMMSTLACDSKYFHHIHDSMSTQCADTPKLAKAIRSTFREMYEEDVLLATWELNGGYDNHLVPPEPRGDLDLSVVEDSLYFFS